MIPAKNRDRKCSTCRHYQPSPLWRKGWCRNPLLYDRNTNHLVEADSLACNRTFIDYWEPITGPTPQVAPQVRPGTKPRIAPSIPIGTTDAQGNRGVVTGNTPASGVPVYTPSEVGDTSFDLTHEPPNVSVILPDLPTHNLEQPGNGAKVTGRIEFIEGPDVPDYRVATAPEPERAVAAAVRSLSAAERIRQARMQQGQFLSTTLGRIALAVAAVLVLGAIIGGLYMAARGQGDTNSPAVIPAASMTVPIPTPTGFGDATVTPVPTNTPVPPPPGVMAIGGWAQVKTSGLTMRAEPSLTGAKITVLKNGTTARIVGGPQAANGVTWWKLDMSSSNPAWVGWCSGQYLAPVGPPSP